ncbi:MAG: hypothetical protein IJZ36_02880 [Bacilli bacterium]|nr:hypothetical protein [Bacilli bacterium]
MTKYKVGQILVSKEEMEIEKGISGEKVKIPKGNKIIIGADKLAHHLKNSFIQPLQEDSEVSGYDKEGLAEYIYLWLRNHFEIDEMLENYDNTKEDFIDFLVEGLDNIGF